MTTSLNNKGASWPPFGCSIKLHDWSHERYKRRHALFCVAYRITQGQSRRAACAAMGSILKINRHALYRLSCRYIKRSPQEARGHA